MRSAGAQGRTSRWRGAWLAWCGIGGAAALLEQRFEVTIGPLVRQYSDAGALGDRRSGVREVLFDAVPPGQAALGRVMWPATRRIMASALGARPALLAELERRLNADLDWFNEQLRGRDYLVGARFGRADLTAARLLAPLARPPACPLYARVRLPPEMAAVVERWSDRPSLRWVRRMYDAHRDEIRNSKLSIRKNYPDY